MNRASAPVLLHELPLHSAERSSGAVALTHRTTSMRYGELGAAVLGFAHGMAALGLLRHERVAIYLDKSFEAVVASFGAPAAGGVFVPLNPLLKPDQVAFILRDCDVRVLVTSADRLALLHEALAGCPGVRHVVVSGEPGEPGAAPQPGAFRPTPWQHLLSHGSASPLPRVIDTDMAAILYTSGSTGKPKGVVLSHRNLVEGARSVASYLANDAHDSLLAALPLSFDAGFSQLTTAFLCSARVVLLNYLLPRDVLKAIERERITGLTAVPPLYIQLAQLDWPAGVADSLRYFANTGGRMPRETLQLLRAKAPRSQPFLMYGLTEAFRSTYLPPEEVDRRPDSIGKAIPNAEILVLRPDGSLCDADEPGELVHRGALVAMGYWNDPEKTAERYRPLPSVAETAGAGAARAGRPAGLPLPEFAVFSGDTVRRDAEGFLYFVGRRDEMIKTSGYRVSPTEVEEALYATRLVGECVAFGVAHPALGQVIQVIATATVSALPAESPDATLDVNALLAACRSRLPAYMVPAGVTVLPAPLPRNPNGKIDRKLLSTQWLEQHSAADASR